MEDQQDKYFKTFILNMFKEPKEGMEKVKNIMCRQNGNITQREI